MKRYAKSAAAVRMDMNAEKTKQKTLYGKLFGSMFVISACTFGGGFGLGCHATFYLCNALIISA